MCPGNMKVKGILLVCSYKTKMSVLLFLYLMRGRNNPSLAGPHIHFICTSSLRYIYIYTLQLIEVNCKCRFEHCVMEIKDYKLYFHLRSFTGFFLSCKRINVMVEIPELCTTEHGRAILAWKC